MRNTDRILVYVVGFVIGTFLVSMIITRRSAKEAVTVDPWELHNTAMLDAGAEPLPDHIPVSMTNGRMLDFGYLPNEANATQRVWLLNFDDSYPYVRVVEDLATGQMQYMAADQVSIQIADGVDVIELKPMLDELGLRLRMFNRKEQIAVIGVLSRELDAVPSTLAAIRPWKRLFREFGPDYIQFKRLVVGDD